MKLGRRGFLKVFGIAPIAAKEAADKALAGAAGFSGEGLAGLGGHRAYMGSGGPPTVSTGNALSIGERCSRAFAFMRRSGIPSWEEERIRLE